MDSKKRTWAGLLWLVCCELLAQPAPQTLAGRVIADEPWQSGGVGFSVGLISDMMLVGVYSDDEAGGLAGAVWSFKRIDGRWVQMQKILPQNPENNMAFGWSLSVDEQIDTGEAWLAVGAPRADNFFGRVDFYRRNEDQWEYMQTLGGPSAGQFGFDVAINVDIPVGQTEFSWTTAVGAPGHRFAANNFSTGAVFVSDLNSLDLWTPPAVPLGLEASATVNNSGIGRSVALDGDFLAAGAPIQAVDGQNSAGAVYTFTRGAFSPFAGNTPIENPDAVMGQQFGGSNFGQDVAVAKQIIPTRQFTGNYYLVVGAPEDSQTIAGGSIYIIDILGSSTGNIARLGRPDRTQVQDDFGWSVTIDQDLINGDHEIIVSSRVQGNGAEGALFTYDQSDLLEPWLPTRQLQIADRLQFPFSSANVGHSVAAWNGLIAAATPNAAPREDAVYTNPVIVFAASFEGP